MTAWLIASGSFALAAPPVKAAEAWHTSTLQWVYPVSNGDFVVGFETNSAACTNANSPKYMHVMVGYNGVTADGIKTLYAAALTALVTGKMVTVAFDDASTSCLVNRLFVHK